MGSECSAVRAGKGGLRHRARLSENVCLAVSLGFLKTGKKKKKTVLNFLRLSERLRQGSGILITPPRIYCGSWDGCFLVGNATVSKVGEFSFA